MSALGVKPKSKAGTGRPFKTAKTVMAAMKKQKLPIQLRISYFHGIEAHRECERVVAVASSDAFNGELKTSNGCFSDLGRRDWYAGAL